jgi:hypothetical protein
MTTNQQEQFAKLLNEISKKLAIGNEVTFVTREKFYGDLSLIDDALSVQLKSFANSYSSYHFIKNDSELRLKMRPVWDSETKRLSTELKQLIEMLAKSLEVHQLSFESYLDEFTI